MSGQHFGERLLQLSLVFQSDRTELEEEQYDDQIWETEKEEDTDEITWTAPQINDEDAYFGDAMDQLNRFLDIVTSKRHYQEDSVDRLNYHYTVWLLLAFALTLSAKQYVGEPIQCWVPAEFSGGWEQYTETYCFIENTYYVKFDDEIPEELEERNQKEIAYYQWVPFFLALEALMFYMPHVFWRLLNWQSGIHLRGIITMACDNRSASGDNAKSSVSDIAGHIHDTLELRQNAPHYGTWVDNLTQCGRPGGVYLTFVYLLMKLLFVGNVILQFFLLNEFLGTTYTFWGATILHDILRENDWQVSGHFPRVTVCDFVVRKLGNNHRYTVQCVLMINMFSEKIFLFIWWWFMAVVCATAVSFLYWLFVTGSAESRHRYIYKLLYGVHGQSEQSISIDPKKFADYLGPDMILVLRLMANNAGELMAARVCKELYSKTIQAKIGRVKKTDATTPDYPSQVTTRPSTIEKSMGAVSNV